MCAPYARLQFATRNSCFGSALVLTLIFMFGVVRSSAQANVNESLETALIYVDAAKGNDNNNGSKTAPLKTIGAAVQAAVANNYASIGTRVIINPGTYRESVVIGGTKRSTNLPITFQAATDGTVFVSGADLIKGWTAYQGSSKIFQASWPHNFGVCPAQPPPAPAQQEIVLHPEMLIVNGKPLTQVLSFSSMLPGTFYVDSPHALVYMYPPVGTNVTTATIETAVRSSVWHISGQSYMVLRGLTFQYANSCWQNPAVAVGGGATNILFDKDLVQWNNAMGADFTNVESVTVQNSIAGHNGEVGFASHQVKKSLWQNNVANYNNWRGALGAFYTWDTGGTKWMWDHSSTYKNIVSNFNQANGVAWDTDNQNVTFTGGVSAMNIVNGMQIEKTQGPIKVSGSYFCYDNLLGIGQRAGIAVRNSEQVSIAGSALYGSLINQFAVVGQPGGIQISNWETGQSYNLITKTLSATGSVFGGPTASVFSDSYLGDSDWLAFVTSVKSNGNTFFSGSGTNAFVIPAPKSGTDVDLTGWRTVTGQDSNSSWKSTSAPAACNVAAESKDFWITSSTYAGATISGGKATINIGTFGLGGITGNIALHLDGISSVTGLKGSLSASSIPPTGSSILTLTTTSSTPRGTYPITILGNLGNTTHAVTISLSVP